MKLTKISITAIIAIFRCIKRYYLINNDMSMNFFEMVGEKSKPVPQIVLKTKYS